MIKTEITNGCIIAYFTDETRINVINAESVKKILKSLFSPPSTRLIIDLNGISFIDSSGFSIFLSMMKVSHTNNSSFKLCNLSRDVLDLFKILHLHTIFEIYGSREEALNSFSD